MYELGTRALGTATWLQMIKPRLEGRIIFELMLISVFLSCQHTEYLLGQNKDTKLLTMT